jgi:hypothetical protein
MHHRPLHVVALALAPVVSYGVSSPYDATAGPHDTAPRLSVG